MSEVFQSLWIGPTLSQMEVLSIRSFLAHGHTYDLYAYDDVAGVPAGARIRDAAEILPRSKIFRYRDGGSFAGFANFFRYKLLQELGGWWVDTDVICVRPFNFEEDFVFASEMAAGKAAITSCVIKAAAGSAVMAYAWEACRRSDPHDLEWGETGPALLGRSVCEHSLEAFVLPPVAFCPWPYDAWRDALDPQRGVRLAPDTWAVHLWHERWRSAGMDKDAAYPAGSLLAGLEAKYRGNGQADSLAPR